MRFVFKLKTKSGSFVDNVYVDARDQKEERLEQGREVLELAVAICLLAVGRTRRHLDGP